MKSLRRNCWIALAAALVITAIIAAGALGRVDRWAQDHLFQQPGAASSDIVLIGIDEASLQELGPYGSWGRDVMASALEALAADPDRLPAVVAVDTLYAGESDPEGDARLAAAASRLPAVVTAVLADFGASYQAAENGGVSVNSYAVLRLEKPYNTLAEATVQGHINAMFDSDGILRHGVLWVDAPAEGRFYSMACEAARLFLAQSGRELRLPATDVRGRYYIPFTGKPGGYSDGYSLSSLISGEIGPETFAGKIVLIGPYAAGLQDAYSTSVSRSEQMYGVEIQANMIQAFLEDNRKQEVPDGPQLAVLFVLSFAAALLFMSLQLKAAAFVTAGLVIAGPAAAWALYAAGFVTHVTWLPAAALLLFVAAIARRYLLALLERQRVTRTFERYVAPEIVQEILKEGTDSLKLGGRLCDIAVLFVDIRGFTAMSERLDPEKVVPILNRYLAVTSSCVERNRGTLDKFVGDATMAFWGAPLPSEDPVFAAAKTALEILRGTEELSAQLKAELGEELRVGIGVHYGPAVVGNMGSERRMDFTAIGDTVNTAARLESNAPGGTVYVSRAVAEALAGRATVAPLAEKLKLKGKAEGFEVFTLTALDS